MANLSQTGARQVEARIGLASLLRYFIAFLAGFAVAMALAVLLIPKSPGPPAAAARPAAPVAVAPAAQPPHQDPDMAKARAAQVQAARELNAISEAAGTTYTPPALDPNAPIDPALISSDRYRNMDKLTTFGVLIGRATGCRFDTRPMDDRIRKWIIEATRNSPADRSTMFAVLQTTVRENAYAQLEGRSPDDCAAVARGLRGHRWP